MASRWDGFQNKPKRRRRVGLDFYEFCFFVVFLSLGILTTAIMLKKPDGWFDDISDERNMIVAIGFVLCGLALLKFDKNARLRAEKQFEYDLTEYEKIKTNWLELQASKLEMEKKYSMEYLTVGQTTPLLVDAPNTTEEIVTIEESEKTNDE
jgi:hypothetical protein